MGVVVDLSSRHRGGLPTVSLLCDRVCDRTPDSAVCSQPYVVEPDADGFTSTRCLACRAAATRRICRVQLRAARRETELSPGGAPV